MNGIAKAALEVVPSGTDRTVVTAAEFAKQFGHYRRRALDRPVFVTSHGRETNVLMSIEQFSCPHRGVLSQERRNLPRLSDFAGWMHQGVVVLDEKMSVVLANPVAHAMLGQTDDAMIGINFYDAVPILKGSLTQAYVNRAAISKEPSAADLPSIIRPGAWCRLEVYPLAHSTTMVFHDITEDVQNNRLADVRDAVVRAATAHPHVARLQINLRGNIDAADDTMCGLLRMTEERLGGVSVVDLVAPGDRLNVREALDDVFGGAGGRPLRTALLANDGRQVRLTAVLAELRGIYGNEGAMLVAVPD